MKKIIFGIIILAVVIYIYSSFLTKGMLVGTYVNRNFNASDTKGIPHFPDTIHVLDNATYTSGYWENGTYKISYTPFATTIVLVHKDMFHSWSIQKLIRRNALIGKPKIIMDSESGQYFEKIK